jgi:murein DD-endopeptidase MepM/ murein hydrolase activator NlpD
MERDELMSTWQLPFPDSKLGARFGAVSKFRIANNLGPHRGTDWIAAEGTKIPAITSGTVMAVQYSKQMGWCIIHTAWADNKTWHIGYSHLQFKPTLKVGDKVETGETLGLIGSTGTASSGPHCHITIGRGLKSLFWGKVLDIRVFIGEQLKKQPTKATVKPKQLAPKVIVPKKVVVPAKAAPKAAKTYVVKSGDSYWKIGRATGVDYRKLQKLNNNKPLQPGDQIRLG